MEEDAAADRPFIAALAISKARGGLPAPRFFAPLFDRRESVFLALKAESRAAKASLP